jgi:hypothetical protein
MTVMEAVRDIIKKCPHLYEYYKILGVDYLGSESTSYSIESVPATSIIKRYVNGDTKRQCLFNFASREVYGEEVRSQLDNIGFFEHFSDWLEEVSSKGLFPELDEGKEVLKIETLTSGYVFDTDLKNAKYQIQCRVIYYQEAI